jgi:hypothetical protein
MSGEKPPAAPGVGPEPFAVARPIDGDDLAAAVAAGVVPTDTALALVRFVAVRPADRPVEAASADEENVRFVTSFNDVFVTIGILLVGGATALVLGDRSPVLAAAATTLLAWGLSEVFSRHWKMAFPSIVLVAGLTISAGVFGASLAGRLGAGSGLAGIAAGAAAVAAGALHWRRFGVPISVAGAAAGAGFLIFALLHGAFPGTLEDHRAPVLLVLGLVVFGLAMWWDAADRERRTRKTDVAFWLHVLAAPAIVHPLVFTTSGLDFDGIATDRPLSILAIYAGLALVALVIDRRALLVSGLLYLGVGTGALIDRLGWAAASSGSVAAGLVGAVVLCLAVGWTPLRNLILRVTPAFVRALVPPPRLPLGR